MSMRAQFVKTATDLLGKDERVVILLGDIGVYGFKEAAERFPGRVLNVGIMEQSMVGIAAGLAKAGFIPIVHTIAPFLAERALEQLKIDFGYQELGGNFVTVGASYDYAALGCTHHCPADVELIRSIPDAKVFVPGTAAEFGWLFRDHYAEKSLNYFRLSETENASTVNDFIVKRGKKATVIAVGPVLTKVLAAVCDLDVEVLYAASLPLNKAALAEYAKSNRILLVEPYYDGGLARDILEALWPRPVLLRTVGVLRRFMTNYGKRKEHDAANGLTPQWIRTELELLIDA
jgi:transketolase